MTDAARHIEQLRKHRVKAARDTSIADLIRNTARTAQKTQKKLGQIIDLWEQHVPAAIVGQTAITALRGGTLHVAVADSAILYEIDRLMREGLEKALRADFGGTLVRVRLKVSPSEVAGDADMR